MNMGDLFGACGWDREKAPWVTPDAAMREKELDEQRQVLGREQRDLKSDLVRFNRCNCFGVDFMRHH